MKLICNFIQELLKVLTFLEKRKYVNELLFIIRSIIIYFKIFKNNELKIIFK